MKTPLLSALLVVAVLALPALAQQSDGAPGDGAPPSREAAPSQASRAGGGNRPLAEAAKGSEDSAAEDKLYIKLERGGEVIFKPVGEARSAKASTEPAPARKPKYKGYSKKGLAAYKKLAEDKRLDKGALGSLAPERAAKAKELAAEAEMNQDVRDTVKEKLRAARAAGAAGAAPAERAKLEAAQEAAESVQKSLGKKMLDFEKKEAAGQKVFKQPAGSAGDDAAERPGEPAPAGQEPGGSPRQ